MGGEGGVAVVAHPIGRDVVRCCGEGDQRALARDLRGRQPAAGQAAAPGGPAAHKGVVAAGVKDQNLGSGRAVVEGVEHLAQGHGFVTHVGLALEPRAQGNQIGLAEIQLPITPSRQHDYQSQSGNMAL